MGLPAWLAVLGMVGATGPAGPAEQLTVSGELDRLGNIHLEARAWPAALDLRIVEEVGGRDVVVPGESTFTTSEADTGWVCERWVRTFRAVADGRSSAPLRVVTPTCAERLRVVTPETVPRGGAIRVKVRDLWRRGATGARLCALPPGAQVSCETIAIPEGQFLTNRVFETDRLGEWHVQITTPFQYVDRAVRVVPPGRPGRRRAAVVTTGDSIMLRVGPAVEKSLGKRARVIGDVYPSAGLQKPFIVDWETLPALQVRAHRPDATVLSLGIGDGGPIETRRGELPCCDERWLDAYAYRARQVMRAYSQGGKAAVVWLNVPYPEGVEPTPLIAVNRALERAAAGLPRVRVLDMAAIFTPRREFQEWIERGGRAIRVRADDGVHLTRAGARIAARAIRRTLARLGVVSGR